MSRYRIGHATGKTQLGGVHTGLFNSEYHFPGGKSAPVRPAAIQANKKTRKSNQNMTF
jgi:hypothetical protein